MHDIYEQIAQGALQAGQNGTKEGGLMAAYNHLFSKLVISMPHSEKIKDADKKEIGDAIEDFQHANKEILFETARQQISNARLPQKELKVNIATLKADMEGLMLHSSLARKLGEKHGYDAHAHFVNGVNEFHSQVFKHPVWQKVVEHARQEK